MISLSGLEASELDIGDGARGSVGAVLGPGGPAGDQGELHPPGQEDAPGVPVS